ncbi:GNAT family N-acetyltransferase [Actinoallomurus purpureus]|uniref:GNAT family N-acetyltransferase n=1 Tax=Actinoallomurus purpureus TaxID=478114 RepID=UPI0020921462|nr:GNAT family protein [Actinoallomurus purpureus]MCO6009325.1 GNAT family N-acetyltransferase [Actinoallomurus purpureus]
MTNRLPRLTICKHALMPHGEPGTQPPITEQSSAAYCWSMGIGLLPEARGRGYGTEAHQLLARYLFAHTTVHRIEADTEVENIAEQRALEKAGFTREGVMRGCGWRDGAWRDGVTYSLLRTDPPA